MQIDPASDDLQNSIVASAEETPFYIAARGEQARRVLKHGDTFAVFDSLGDIGALATGEDGVFHCDTRHLSVAYPVDSGSSTCSGYAGLMG